MLCTRKLEFQNSEALWDDESNKKFNLNFLVLEKHSKIVY